MIRLLYIGSISLLAALSTGCAVVVSPVGNGAIFTNVSGPIASGSEVEATKSGRACAANYVGLVAAGDASIESAKKNGDITSVSAVDHKSFSVLGVYSRFCTIVTGR